MKPSVVLIFFVGLVALPSHHGSLLPTGTFASKYLKKSRTLSCVDASKKESSSNEPKNSNSGWWGRGGPPQKLPGPDNSNVELYHLKALSPDNSGSTVESLMMKKKQKKKSRRSTNVYKHLFRHGNLADDDALNNNDPKAFLQSCNYTQNEIEAMIHNFPALLSLNVQTSLTPKIRFMVHTLGGGQKRVSTGNATEQWLVSHQAKTIPPSYFGCRLERTLALRHAYLVYANSIYGKKLLENDCYFLKELLSTSGKSLPEFCALCNRWEALQPPHGGTPLSKGIIQKQHHSIEKIEAFERVFRRGLLAACRNGTSDELKLLKCSPGRMVELLLMHGANPREVDSSGASLLHWAAGTGNVDGLKCLIDALVVGNDVDLSDSVPLSMEESVSRLILESRGAKDGATPLHWACCGVSPNCFGSGGHVNICQMLIQLSGRNKQSLTSAPTITGNTPLMWASWSGSLSVIKILLHHGADAIKTNINGCSAAHWAASGGYLNVCIYLHEQCDLDFTRPNKNGHTPLNHAIVHGHVDVVQWIISNVHKGNAVKMIEEENLARDFLNWKGGDETRKAILELFQ